MNHTLHEFLLFYLSPQHETYNNLMNANVIHNTDKLYEFVSGRYIKFNYETEF